MRFCRADAWTCGVGEQMEALMDCSDIQLECDAGLLVSMQGMQQSATITRLFHPHLYPGITASLPRQKAGHHVTKTPH